MKTLSLILLLSLMSIPCNAQDRRETKQKPKTEPSQATSKEKLVKLTPDGEAHTPSIWMQQKLKHSQKIFAGMVEGDLFAVEDAARNLKFTSRLEHFVKARHKGYRTQLKAFYFANEEILKGAREKNIDRVTLGYNQMTVSCVACHKQLRGGKGNKESKQ